MKRPRDRPLRLASTLTPLACGFACLGIARLLSYWPEGVERFYAAGIAPVLIMLLSRVSGLFTVSLAEVLGFAFLLHQAVAALRALRAVWCKQRRLSNALTAGILGWIRYAGWGTVLFYLLWGFHYSRAPLADRLGWQGASRPTEAGELIPLTEEMIEAVNSAYDVLHGTEDLGRPTETPGDAAGWEAALDSGWSRLPGSLPGINIRQWSYGRFKPVISSQVMSYLGLGGFFFPWTGEPNVNSDMPAIAIPHSVAHEKAHQRGFASEDEANFIGFVVGSVSEDPFVRYSATLFAQRQLLRALFREDPDTASILLKRRYPGVQRDVDDLRAYWEHFEGPAEVAAARVNDLYLKSNQVEEGTRSYGLSLLLLLEYSRTQGGTLLPLAP